MRYLALLLIHLMVTIARLFRSGGARANIAKSLVVKHQLLVLNRLSERAQTQANGSSHYNAFRQ